MIQDFNTHIEFIRKGVAAGIIPETVLRNVYLCNYYLLDRDIRGNSSRSAVFWAAEMCNVSLSYAYRVLQQFQIKTYEPADVEILPFVLEAA